MNFDASTLWWVLAGLLVVAELLSGTFYLLMFALGCAAAALATHAGLGFSIQLVVAALISGGATAAWHFKRARAPRSEPAESNRDVNLDIGQSVFVDVWGADGAARVQYRGATWAVRFAGSGAPVPGAHRIIAVRGNSFDVEPAASN
ncbi:MAG: NfeD family protein [Planctomycetes bacterium]|nr:NfeD family protein [Planctomycetota bacterium]